MYKKRKGFENAIKKACKERKLICNFRTNPELERTGAIVLIDYARRQTFEIRFTIVWSPSREKAWVVCIKEMRCRGLYDVFSIPCCNLSEVRCREASQVLAALDDYLKTFDFESQLSGLSNEQQQVWF